MLWNEIRIYLQNALAIAICSSRATRGQNITIDPKFWIMSGKVYSVPLKFVLNGGGLNEGKPFWTSPKKLNQNVFLKKKTMILIQKFSFSQDQFFQMNIFKF